MASILKIKDQNGNWQEIQTIVGSKGEKGDNGNDYVITEQDYQEIANIVESEINIPTKTSDLTNDSNFIDNTYHDSTKQNTLVSGTNIKTINNESVLGEGNIEIPDYNDKIIVIKSTDTNEQIIEKINNWLNNQDKTLLYKTTTLIYTIIKINNYSTYMELLFGTLFGEGINQYAPVPTYLSCQFQKIKITLSNNVATAVTYNDGTYYQIATTGIKLKNRINMDSSFTNYTDDSLITKKYVDNKVSTEIGNINTILATLTTVEEGE